MYEVIGSIPSRTFRVLWMLEELGAPYDHVNARPRSKEARTYNPAGKVPVLISDGVTLTDSTAILTFLADRHGRFTFPPGTTDRAQQDGFTQFINDELDAWNAPSDFVRRHFSETEDRELRTSGTSRTC